MNIKFKLLSIFLSCCLLYQSAWPAWAAANANKQELIRLQTQAKQTLAKHPQTENYIRQILLLSAETAILTALASQSQKRLALAFISAKEDPVFSVPQRSLPSKEQNRMLFAKKPKIELSGNLFDQPPAKPKRDLSWLEEPDRPLKPRPQQPTLFDLPPTEVKPKTFLSKQILERFQVRINRLPISEKQALIETIDEAVLIQRKHGRHAAWEFLEKKAFQSSTTSLYLVMAQRALWAMSILLVVGFFMHPVSSEKMTQRLARNPTLFLDASEEQLEQLSHHPQAVDFAKSIVQTVDLLAQSLPASLETQDASRRLPATFISPTQLAR